MDSSVEPEGPDVRSLLAGGIDPAEGVVADSSRPVGTEDTGLAEGDIDLVVEDIDPAGEDIDLVGEDIDLVGEDIGPVEEGTGPVEEGTGPVEDTDPAAVGVGLVEEDTGRSPEVAVLGKVNIVTPGSTRSTGYIRPYGGCPYPWYDISVVAWISSDWQ